MALPPLPSLPTLQGGATIAGGATTPAGADNGLPFAIDWFGDGSTVTGNPGIVNKDAIPAGQQFLNSLGQSDTAKTVATYAVTGLVSLALIWYGIGKVLKV